MIKKGYAYVCKIVKIDRDSYTKQVIPPRFQGFLVRFVYLLLGATIGVLGYIVSENSRTIEIIKPIFIERVKIVEVLPKAIIPIIKKKIIKYCHHK